VVRFGYKFQGKSNTLFDISVMEIP